MTVGELRKIILPLDDECPLLFYNRYEAGGEKHYRIQSAEMGTSENGEYGLVFSDEPEGVNWK